MTTPSILAYVRTGSILTGANYTVIPDYTNNLVYATIPQSNFGLAKFNGYTADTDLLEQFLTAWATIIGAPEYLLTGAFALSHSGHILFHSYHATGKPAHPVRTYMEAIRASDLSFTAQIEIPDSSTMASMVPLLSGSTEYVIVGNEITTGAHANIYYAPVPSLASFTTLFTIDEKYAELGRGSASGTGTAFVLGAPSTPSASFGLYKISSAGGAIPTYAKLGTISPAQVDATWTNITSYSGLAYDQTDGNVIARFHTSDSVANQHYVVKLSATNASVLWTCAIGAITESAYGEGMCRSNITAQQYFVLCGNALYTINTSTGVATSATIGTLTATAATSATQISDDASGSIFVRGTWSQTSTTPNYLGSYMGSPGNHTAIASQTWMRFFPGAVPSPPVPTPPAPPFPIISVNRAWTYTLDGHTFYVLDLGAEGTFVYDTTTEQWSQFQTNGSNWNFANGCMWGSRIVGGDLASTDVWELVPGATFDNGTQNVEIAHVATGGLTMRTRDYRSCDALRLALSWGEYQDPAAATISLSWSDDFGETFTTPTTISLTEGDFTSEITWRSLGSFAAPGRIFSITDVGGPLRLDGCDAMIDGFDNDKPQE